MLSSLYLTMRLGIQVLYDPLVKKAGPRDFAGLTITRRKRGRVI